MGLELKTYPKGETMTTYHISFRGREKGALGIYSNYAQTVEANTEEEAILKLYDTHEHIEVLSIKILSKTQKDKK